MPTRLFNPERAWAHRMYTKHRSWVHAYGETLAKEWPFHLRWARQDCHIRTLFRTHLPPPCHSLLILYFLPLVTIRDRGPALEPSWRLWWGGCWCGRNPCVKGLRSSKAGGDWSVIQSPCSPGTGASMIGYGWINYPASFLDYVNPALFTTASPVMTFCWVN